MKRFIITFLVFNLCLIPLALLQAGGSLACGGSITVTRDGKTTGKLSNPAKLMEDLQALLQSCSVDSSKNASRTKWENLLKSPSHLHYKMPDNLSFHLPLQAEIQADVVEIILPLPKGEWPDHVYVKNAKGYFSYSKYGPKELKKIVGHPEIGLSSVAPYSSLAGLAETK